MSNEVKKLIKKIQAELPDLTQGDIGAKLGYTSVSHFNTLIGKGGEELASLLKLHYPFLNEQNVRKTEDNGKLLPGKRVLTTDDYLKRVEGEVEFLRGIVASGLSTLLTNSEKVLENQQIGLPKIVAGVGLLEDFFSRVTGIDPETVKAGVNKVVSETQETMKKSNKSAGSHNKV